MNTILFILIKSYAFLLRMFPPTYQREFAEEMLLDFSDLAADASKKGNWALILFCLRELVDFPINLWHAHRKENRMFKILRSQPVTTGFRSALGFGIAFGLTLPILMFVSQALLPRIDPIVTHLQIFFYDRFHVEQEFRLISWIPSVLSFLLIGLVLGGVFAILFADRSMYPRYILAGLLGWFFYSAIHDLLTIFFDFGVFLTGTQYAVFCHILRAFSGAIFGLIFVAAHSERPGSLRLLAISIFADLLFVFLFAEVLFKTFVFMTPWRFVGSAFLMMVLVISVLLLARKMEGERKIPLIVIAGAIGYPVIMYMAYLFAQFVGPASGLSDAFDHSSSVFWQRTFMFALEQAIYGTLLGLLLGLVFGYQGKNNLPELEEI